MKDFIRNGFSAGGFLECMGRLSLEVLCGGVYALAGSVLNQTKRSVTSFPGDSQDLARIDRASGGQVIQLQERGQIHFVPPGDQIGRIAGPDPVFFR